MLKKLVSLVVGVSCLAATMGVAAKTPTVATVSEYDMGDTTKVAVVTTVTNVAAGETYTYLAAKENIGTVSAGRDIAYIDQKTAATTDNIVFDYKVNASESITGQIKVGGKEANGTAMSVEGTNIIQPNQTLMKVKVNDGDETQVVVDNAADNNSYTLVKATVTGEVTDVKVGGTTLSDADYIASSQGAWIKGSYVASNAVVVITTDAPVVATKYQTIAAGYTTDNSGTIYAMGKVEGNVAAEYGIQIANNSDFTDAKDLKAMGIGDNGVYIIKAEGVGTVFSEAGEVYVRAYYTGATDTNSIVYKITLGTNGAGVKQQ